MEGEFKMRNKLLVTIIFILLVSSLAAEEVEPPKPVLNKGDVEQFIKTFPQLKKDLKKYEAKDEEDAGDITYPEALKANVEFMAILKKHGWDEKFFPKLEAISIGYMISIAEEDAKEMESKNEKAIKEINSNSALSEAMKKQMIQSMEMAKGQMKIQQDLFKTRIHPKDIELIKPHIEEIKKLFEEE